MYDDYHPLDEIRWRRDAEQGNHKCDCVSGYPLGNTEHFVLVVVFSLCSDWVVLFSHSLFVATPCFPKEI